MGYFSRETSRAAKKGGSKVPMYLVTANWNNDQLRISIPKILVEHLEWKDVRFVMMEAQGTEYLTVRRFIDGESLKNIRASNKADIN